MKETVPIARIPRTTMTATTIRMILRALPLFWVEAGAVPAGVMGAAAAPGWVVPHLLQNFAPLSRVAPQELQNAIAAPRRYLFFRRRSISQIRAAGWCSPPGLVPTATGERR